MKIHEMVQKEEQQYLSSLIAEDAMVKEATNRLDQEIFDALSRMGLDFIIAGIDREQRKVTHLKQSGHLAIGYTAALNFGYTDLTGNLHIESGKIEIWYSFNGNNKKILTEQDFAQDYARAKMFGVMNLIKQLDTTVKRDDFEKYLSEKVARLKQLDSDGLYDKTFGWKAIVKTKREERKEYKMMMAKRDLAEKERQERESVWIAQAEQAYAAEFEAWAADIASVHKQNAEHVAKIQAAIDLKPFWWAELQYVCWLDSPMMEKVVILGLREFDLLPGKDFYNLLLPSGRHTSRHFSNIVWIGEPRLAKPNDRKPYNANYFGRDLVLYTSPFESVPKMDIIPEPAMPNKPTGKPNYVRRTPEFQRIRHEVMEKFGLDD